ncbi:hypothetical protein ACW73L_07945 [Methylolobus aquaticus]|uniref:hypothetical protein n=1 Tax=Methylotetracoccus oryzae TaxID=1919059 RepID=UPI00111B6081|nr:hypothetical protein [Methylotetracoccus oryzae]
MKRSSLFAAPYALVAAISGWVGPLSVPAALAGDHETQCFNEIQGKIAWDGDKRMNWDPDNVKQLCRGTNMPAEPGKCFLAVSSGHAKGQVSWGPGTQWEWRNIINLCAGTNDGMKTVGCFNNGVKTGADWRDVILTCQRNS